jgi:hypothetical protein
MLKCSFLIRYENLCLCSTICKAASYYKTTTMSFHGQFQGANFPTFKLYNKTHWC